MTSNDRPDQDLDADDQDRGHAVQPEGGKPSQAEGDDDDTSA